MSYSASTGMQVPLRQETMHRPMDLRADRSHVSSGSKTPTRRQLMTSSAEHWTCALKIASSIAAEARAAVKVQILC
jgi:hypothetical protein